jgi:hypothetical protein
MKSPLLFSIFFSLSISSFAQTFSTDSTRKADNCNCCRDVQYTETVHKPFTSLKTDTVTGRLSFFTNLAYQPMRLREQQTNGTFRSQAPTYLTWDFLEGEGMLVRGLYWGGQFGVGIPFGGRALSQRDTRFENRFGASWYFGTHLTADLLRFRRVKIFAMANFQAAFNHVRIDREATSNAQGGWYANFIQPRLGDTYLEFAQMTEAMLNTQRDRIRMWQFTAQVQGSLGADILLNPNGFTLRLQGGYQLPFEGLTSAWRYSYEEQLNNANTNPNDPNDNTRTLRFRVNNTPFSYVQEGIFAKISFTWLFNKGKREVRTRRECCDDYYRYSSNNNDNTSPNGGGVNTNPTRVPRTPRTTPTPRTNTPRTTPKTPKPIPR